MSFFRKHQKFLFLFILLLGFFLRFYSAASMPMNWDEETFLNVPQEIAVGDFCGNKISRSIPQIGRLVFGDSLLGARLPYVFMATIIIFIVFFFVKTIFDTETALLAALFLSISQYDIGLTRYVESSNYIFFSVLALFCFYKAISSSNKYLLIFSGLCIGIGFWFKENPIILIPIFIIFLAVSPRYRHWLKNKYLWISFLTAMILIIPNILLDISPGTVRYDYFHYAVRIGLSINALAVYLGEIILILMQPFGKLYGYVVPSLDPQFPMVNFIFGIIIMIAVIRALWDKRAFIKLLLVCFLVNFIPFMFLRGGEEEINSFWCLSNLDWSLLNFIPGVILAADMLKNFAGKETIKKKFLIILIIYMFVRTIIFISYPIPYCFPAINHSINIQLSVRVPHFLEKGDLKTAKEILQRIYKITDNRPRFKRKAALKLAQIEIMQNHPQEAREYIYYLLSQNADNRTALKLLKKL